MIKFLLEQMIAYLDKMIKISVDKADMGSNKHFLTACWLFKRYYPEAVAAALETDTSFDDKIVEELKQVADHYWPDDKMIPAG